MSHTENNSFDIYDDPNPPKWPNTRIPFNRWYTKLHDFIYALQTQFYWGRHPLFSKVKYLNIRVDTRNGNFTVWREADKANGEPVSISPDELGLEYKSIPFSVEMRPMSEAPTAEPILLYSKKFKHIVGRYGCKALLDHATVPGGNEFWQTSVGALNFNSNDLLGWWELPKVKEGP